MIGIDIVKVNRVESLIDRWGRGFIDRIFTPAEQEYCEDKRNKNQCYAVRFAAKESFYKAFNHSYGWKALEVINNGVEPHIHILDERLKSEVMKYKINLSISHIEDIGIALVLLSVK